MIVGTLMALETCLILGPGFTQFTLLEAKAPDGYMWSGEINEETVYIQARSSMARALEINGKTCQAEGKAKVVRGKDSP